MGFAKERVKCKIQHLCFLSAKTIFYLLKKCKLANKKMVLLRWCKAESFGFLIRSFANTRDVMPNAMSDRANINI